MDMNMDMDIGYNHNNILFLKLYYERSNKKKYSY
jgi:hypothetical protein